MKLLRRRRQERTGAVEWQLSSCHFLRQYPVWTHVHDSTRRFGSKPNKIAHAVELGSQYQLRARNPCEIIEGDLCQASSHYSIKVVYEIEADFAVLADGRRQCPKRNVGQTRISRFSRLWFAKMSSLARSLRISNIQIEVHWWAYEDRHVTLLHGPGGTLAGPDGGFGRHRSKGSTIGSPQHKVSRTPGVGLHVRRIWNKNGAEAAARRVILKIVDDLLALLQRRFGPRRL